MPGRLAVAHGPRWLAVLHGVGDHQDFLVRRMSAFLQLLGVDHELPEMTGKVDLLLVCYIGTPEAKHAIVEPVFANLCNVLFVIVVEVEANDIRTNVASVLDR